MSKALVNKIKLNDVVSAKDFGAVGDGITNDTAALQAMFATNKPWYIPYTSDGYLVDAILAPKASGECEGFLLADTGYADLVINITGLGYQPNTKITGLDIRCKSPRTAGSVGIRVNSPSVVLDRCKAQAFDYGIQIWSYSIALMNCNANLCNTNLSAYAPSPTSEINDLKIIGGNFDSATQYSCRIGDPRFSTTVPAGELMGTSVLIQGAAFDGATSTFDRIFSLTIQSCYWEGPALGNAIELGGAGDGWMRNVEIAGCYFSTVKNAIYCNSAILALKVRPNYYGGGMYCALYAIKSELYGVEYQQGTSTSGFLGSEVHTGYSSGVAVSQLTFATVSLSHDYLVKGSQLAPETTYTDNWYPNGLTNNGYKHISSAYGRYRNTAYSGIVGTMSGNQFTCTTKADSYKFNGGDRVTTSIGGSSFVAFVNYDTGVITVNGTASGAATISHSSAAVFQDQRMSSGTWDVTLTPATSGTITVNPSFNAASYTRIGNLVSVQGQIQVQSVSSPVGATVKLSLPFATSDQPELAGRFGGTVNYNNTATTFFSEEGDLFVYLNASAASFASPQNIFFSFSYVAVSV